MIAFFEKCYSFEKLGPWSDLKESYEKATKVCEQFGSVTEYYSRLETVSSTKMLDRAIDMLGDLQGCLELKMNLEFEETVLEVIQYAEMLSESQPQEESRLSKVEALFKVFMAYSMPEVRERILRRLFLKLRAP